MKSFHHLLKPTVARLLALALSSVTVLGVVAWDGGQRLEAQQLQGSDVDDARARFAQLSLQLESLRDERRGLERRYQKLTDAITERKRNRSRADLLGDINLGNMLQEARALSERLYNVQERLRGAERRLEGARRQLLTAYDARIDALEGEVIDSVSELERAEAIGALNQLRKERQAYVAPTAAFPELNLASLPTLEDVSGDPEEAEAAAAELDDTRARVDERIDALQQEIERLEGERRVRRTARDFRDRESFFDDATPGGRRVARSDASPRAPLGTDKEEAGGQATGGDANDGAVDVDGQGDAAPPQDDAPTADEGAPEGLDNDFESDDDGFEPNVDADPSVGDRGAGDVANDPTLGRPDLLPGAGGLPTDPFGGDQVILRGEVETLGPADEGAVAEGGSLDDRLRKLQREKKSLERKSRELEARSKALKQQAGDF